MSAYNFQKQFAGEIEAGRKRSTIRARRKNGYVPTPGERIKLYTGMRTKGCRLLRSVKVLRVTPVTITESNNPFVPKIIIDGAPLPHDRAYGIVRKDGFESFQAFKEFFEDQYGLPFNGYLIEW